MSRRAFLLVLVGLLAAVPPPVEAGPAGLRFRRPSSEEVSLPELLADLRRARVVLVGERHDRRAHHEVQLFLIRELAEGGANVAVGLEMFRADVQADVDRWLAGELADREFHRLFADNWDRRLWPLYSDIFFYARRNRIPLVGLNAPRRLVTQVAREGFASLEETHRRQLGVVRCDVDERYQELMGRVLGTEDVGSETFGRFCEAQVVWDTAMARNALGYLDAAPDRILLVLAGNVHAWRHGIPEQLGRLSEVPYRIVLPASDEGLLRHDLLLEDADYVWWRE